MNNIRIIFIAAVSLLLSACAAVYKPPAEGGKTAKLNIASGGQKWICINNQRQLIYADKSEYVDIPAGNRITVGTNFSVNNGSFIINCAHQSSFIPEVGKKYYLAFDLKDGKCSSLVYIEDKHNRTGVGFEPSLQKATDCTVN